MNDLDRLVVGVTHDTEPRSALGRLLGNIARHVESGLSPEGGANFAALLRDNADVLISHVIAGTPRVQVRPEVWPTPQARPGSHPAPADSPPATKRALTEDKHIDPTALEAARRDYAAISLSPSLEKWDAFIQHGESYLAAHAEAGDADPGIAPLIDAAREKRAKLAP